MIDLTNLRLTGCVSASGEQNEDGTFRVECEVTVENDDGFRGTLSIVCPHATEPVKVKKNYEGNDDLDMLIWLMDNGFTGVPTIVQDVNNPCILHTKTPLNVVCNQKFGLIENVE